MRAKGMVWKMQSTGYKRLRIVQLSAIVGTVHPYSHIKPPVPAFVGVANFAARGCRLGVWIVLD